MQKLDQDIGVAVGFQVRPSGGVQRMGLIGTSIRAPQ
jgi:hypothetical protein